MAAFGMGSLELIAVGTDVYLRGKAFEPLTKNDARWLYVDLTSKKPATAEFASIAGGENDASLMVYYLLGATGDVEDLGTEDVDGVSTDHVGVELDLDAALEAAPEDARAVFIENIDEQRANGVVDNLDGEVWIDQDGLVRRVSYGFGLSAQMGGGEMTAVVDLSEIGETVDIDIPDKNDIVDLDDIAL
jgi:hypothetical protein